MNHREMRSKLLSSYGRFVFFPENPEVPKICSTKAFNYLVIGDSTVLYAHKSMEEQIEEELEEGYDVIYGEPELRRVYFISPYTKISNLRKNFRNGSEILKKAMKKPFEEEIEILRDLGNRIKIALEKTFNAISIGMKESEIKSILECELLKTGVESFSYPSIIASGKRGKYFFPCSMDKEIREGEIIYIDSSPLYKGYNLNFSRVIFTKEREDWIISLEKINKLYQEISKIVRPGLSCNFIDNYIRNRIGNFPHYSIVPAGGFYMPYAPMDAILEENMVFTMVPSIYPEGGVIRVKRNILVKKNAMEFLD